MNVCSISRGVGSDDFFLSRDGGCEGYIAVSHFYLWPTKVVGTHPIYRCITAAGEHFTSPDPGCEGGGRQESAVGFVNDRIG